MSVIVTQPLRATSTGQCSAWLTCPICAGTADLGFLVGEHGRFDLDDAVMRAVMYRTVVREARNPTDLTDFLDGDTLVRVWPGLSPCLPREVRATWEEQHPVLRACGRSLCDLLRQVI